MAKIGGDKPADIAVMSEAMKKSIKKEVAKFGFEPWKFDDFLFSVMAQKNETVMSYPLDEMERYRSEFVKKHENGLNDVFTFEKFAKVGDRFIPRMFWDQAIKT